MFGPGRQGGRFAQALAIPGVAAGIGVRLWRKRITLTEAPAGLACGSRRRRGQLCLESTAAPFMIALTRARASPVKGVADVQGELTRTRSLVAGPRPFLKMVDGAGIAGPHGTAGLTLPRLPTLLVTHQSGAVYAR